MKVFYLIALALTLSVSVFAQDIPEQKESTPIPQSITLLEVAGQLAKYGYSEREALPLIQAAEIFQNLAGKALEAEVEHQGGTSSQEKPEKVSFEPSKLLADATEMADGDQTLLSLIQNVKTSATRGRVGGPTTHKDTVKAGATDIYNIPFYGNEEASVLVIGDGDTDLDLFIYDDNDNFITSDTDSGDTCLAQWTPRRTGKFKVKIKNYGNVYNRYTLYVK